MRTDMSKSLSGYERFLVALLYISIDIGLFASVTIAGQMPVSAVDFGAFRKALEESDDITAMSLGSSIFSQLEKKYKKDTGFSAMKSKLMAAEFLARQMKFQLQKATGKRMLTVAAGLFDKKEGDSRDLSLLVAPAKSFYETSAKLFSSSVKIDGLSDEEKTFLLRYYDLKLRLLTISVAQAGQNLAIAEPSFNGAHDYALVLPLLHSSAEKPVNTDILPPWMRQGEQLEILSDSCLLHFGLVLPAMAIEKRSAQGQQKPFSELDFYVSAAEKCRQSESSPHIAVDCLLKAIDRAPDKAPDIIVSLRFDVVQVWLDSENYVLAGGEAQKIYDTFPDHKEAGRAIWLHYYALSRSNSADEILAHIDEVLEDKRCDVYKAKLMYIKWWALRRKRDQTARVAGFEYELLRQYGNDPMFAPVLLSRATDLLARQDYNGARESLTRLSEKFPSTEAGAQARKMLHKLQATNDLR